MKAFKSERELARYFAALAERRRREELRRAARARREALRQARRAAKPSGDMVIITAPPVAAVEATVTVQTVAETVTNTQHAGVDEGDIVKVHGDHLVVLRRGRLFTIAISDRDLKPISTVNAFGSGIDPENSWYDEMLVSEHKVIVIGYSYERGGTEVG